MKYNILRKKLATHEILVVFLLFIISVLVRFFIADRFPLNIQCYPDELRYYHIASSIANGTGISIYNAATDFQKILYSLFLVPACTTSNISTKISLIFLTNSILMSSGVFFVYYLSKHFIRDNIYKIAICFIYLLFGYMTYTMTFISENLWIPLSLCVICIFYKLFQFQELNDKKYILIFNLTAGISSYIAYLCKEIALIFPLAYIILLLVWVIIKKHHGKPQYSNYINQILVFSTGFTIPFILLKLTLFTGLGNSYHQQSLDALAGEDKIYYLSYGTVYFLINILLMSYILPAIAPIFCFSRLSYSTKKFYIFIWILILITAAIISYTITIREDYPSLVPRVHTRYIAWITILFFIIFVHLIEQNLIRINHNYSILFIFILTILFLPLLYRGIGKGSTIDNTIFIFSNMSLNEIFSTMCLIVVFSSISMYFIESKGKIICTAFIIILIFIQTYDNYHGIELQKNTYKTRIEDYNEAIAIKNFIEYNNNCNFLLFENFLSKNSKILDTYLTNKNVLTSSLEKINVTDGISLEGINIPVIWSDKQKQTYKKQKIDYIILKTPAFAITSSNCILVNNINISRYNIYKILDSNKPIFISESYLDKDQKIFFSGSLWNADEYIKNGIFSSEKDFTWSIGNEIVFKKIKIGKEQKSIEYKMRISLFGIYTDKQTITILCNNRSIYKNIIDNKTKNIDIPVITDEKGYLHLRILLPDAISPKARGESEDNRSLAIALKSISFEN